ncbi:hypothetical protein ES703_20338 [subsurface metagenome]
MAVIKSMSEIAKKWATVTPGRAAYYETGVRTTAKDWAGATAGAVSAYEAGVTEAIGRGAYQSGVSARGTSGWREATLAKKDRWAAGVRIGESRYTQGFAPFRAVIEGVTLPPRGPRGDPSNYARCEAIGLALTSARKATS